MNQTIGTLKEKLKDQRSKKVMFVSHCIFNENVRYLGGAFRKGGVDEIIDDLQKQGIGMVQMKCPEQKAWGGVLKRYGLIAYGMRSRMPKIYVFRKLFVLLFIWYTKRTYRRLAKEIVSEMADYIHSGFEVSGILGIDGSPSCGINKRLDIKKSFEYIAGIDPKKLVRDEMNSHIYEECLFEGKGLFIEALEIEMKNKNIRIELFSHDLSSEMNIAKED